MSAATGDGDGQVRESASGEGREPNCKLRSSNASMEVDVKKNAAGTAAHTPEVRCE